MAELNVSDFVLVGSKMKIRPHQSEGKVELNADYERKILNSTYANKLTCCT